MITPNIIPFRAEHLLELEFRDRDREETMMAAIKHERTGPCYTVIMDGRILGCAGISINWPGCACGWAVLSSELMKKYPIWTTKMMKHIMRDTMRAFNLHRLEMITSDEYRKWGRVLGFTPEIDGAARLYTARKATMYRMEMINDSTR